ncbi:MAG: transposase [Armatimonadota bacterium]|nr:transposase [Armatimonadota bacterium]
MFTILPQPLLLASKTLRTCVLFTFMVYYYIGNPTGASAMNTAANVREQRGKELADKVNIQRIGKGVGGVFGKWVVPSSTGNGRYTVDMDGPVARCNCPDFEPRQVNCKHIYAVEYVIRRQTKTETNSDGSTTVTETVTETATAKRETTTRKTYSQVWPAYNAAQTNEKHLFQILLHDLCAAIKSPEQDFGRPRLPLGDIVFAAAFKVYSTISCRRFMCDLKDAHAKGHLSTLPSHSAIFKYMEQEDMTPILHKLIKRSAAPLKAIETEFAVDSSGFSTCRTVTWFNTRYGHEQDNKDWLKLHLMTGVKTNVVTSVEVTGRYSNDAPHFGPLVKDTAERFTIKKVSADKAYATVANHKAAQKEGATAYIPFKSNATGAATAQAHKNDGGCGLWRQMWHYYQMHRDEFLEHYHMRSNVESTFSMVKAKFGDSLRSKDDTAQENEALCKILCHNICCVIQSMYELGIEPDFGTGQIEAEKAVAQTVETV